MYVGFILDFLFICKFIIKVYLFCRKIVSVILNIYVRYYSNYILIEFIFFKCIEILVFDNIRIEFIKKCLFNYLI